MEKIIAQIKKKATIEFCKIIEDSIMNGSGFESILYESRRPIANISTLCIAQLIETLDKMIIDNRGARKEAGITIHQRNISRTIVTVYGVLTYKRTYFKLKNGKKVFLIDKILDITPYMRVSKDLCAVLVNRAAETSLRKAAAEMGNLVSAQTICNKIQALPELVADVKKADHTPEDLHIFVDEDHVHLRPKKNAIVPLVVITEGIDETDKKRHKTISPYYLEGYGISISAFIENIHAVLNERYDMDKVKHIYVHGDGAPWIKKLTDSLPLSVPVMDEFHLKKYLKKLSAVNGAKKYMNAIKKTLTDDDKTSFDFYIEALFALQDKKGEKTLRELSGYFYNNWDSIVNRLSNKCCGSCTEPLVGHKLSKRLSRNPLAWTRSGLIKMAMLRIYIENGGVVTAQDIRISRSSEERAEDFTELIDGFRKYNDYAEKQLHEAIEESYDWSIFDNLYSNTSLTSINVTGTTALIKRFAELYDNSFAM